MDKIKKYIKNRAVVSTLALAVGAGFGAATISYNNVVNAETNDVETVESIDQAEPITYIGTEPSTEDTGDQEKTLAEFQQEWKKPTYGLEGFQIVSLARKTAMERHIENVDERVDTYYGSLQFDMMIIVSHDFLDDALSWDRWKEYADKDNEIWNNEWRNNQFVRVQNMMKGSLELIESKDERFYPLRSDLNMVIGLIDYAKENKDYKALLDAHRIVHDIEHYTFQALRTHEYFGVTMIMEGSYDNLMSDYRPEE